MPTKQGGRALKNASTSDRCSFRRNTALPAASTPCSWKTRLAMSKPTVVISMVDGSFSSLHPTARAWHIDAVRGRPPHQIFTTRAGCQRYLVTRVVRQPHDRAVQLSSTLCWLVDAAAETAGADRLLAELGAHLLEDGLPLAGGALTLEVPHPLIARRTWLWRAESGEVIEALGFAPGEPAATQEASPSDDAGRRWLAGIAAGRVHQ